MKTFKNEWNMKTCSVNSSVNNRKKLDAIKSFEKGENTSKLKSQFNIQLCDLNKQKNKLYDFTANNDVRLSKLKTVKNATLDDLEKAFFL